MTNSFDDIIVTALPGVPGLEIVSILQEYSVVVCVSDAAGLAAVAQVTDEVRGRLADRARGVGADAVLALSVQYNESTLPRSLVAVASGVIVKLRRLGPSVM